MMDTRLRDLLHEIATEMPLDVEGSAPRTLRRARGRRVLTAGAGVAILVALVFVSASALRLGNETSPTPVVPGPNQARAFEGLWPETDADALAATQEAVDEGHMPLRTTPDGTATLLATNLLGWDPDEVTWRPTGGTGPASANAPVLLEISDRSFVESVPPITVELRQLGATGPNGIWSVVGVSTPLIELDDLVALSPEGPATMPGALVVSGHVTDLFDGAPAVEAHVFDGPSLVPSLGSARRELRDARFDLRVSVEATPDGEATLLVTVPDATGASLGAELLPVDTPVGEAGSSGPNLTDLPPDVAATAQRIYDAAKARDFQALAELIDPNTFVFNFDDGSDPTDAWRADRSALDGMVEVLRLRAAAPLKIKGYGTLYIWPYLKDSDFDTLTDGERSDLVSLGFSDRDIRLMIEGGYGYQGPRLAIDATGLWRSYTTMGE